MRVSYTHIPRHIADDYRVRYSRLVKAYTRACKKAAHASVWHEENTEECARLDEVRRAIGREKIDLYLEIYHENTRYHHIRQIMAYGLADVYRRSPLYAGDLERIEAVARENVILGRV